MIHPRKFLSFAIAVIIVASAFFYLGTERVSAQGCVIEIEKIAFPAIDTQFEFSIPGAFPSSFTLMDPSDDTTQLELPFFSGELILTEEVPQGWRVEEIVCETPEFSNVTITQGPLSNEVTLECFGKSKSKGTPSCSFVNILEERSIPTLSEWGLIILAVALGVFVLIAGRKKLIKS